MVILNKLAIEIDGLLSVFVIITFRNHSSIAEKILHLEEQQAIVTYALVETRKDHPTAQKRNHNCTISITVERYNFKT